MTEPTKRVLEFEFGPFSTKFMLVIFIFGIYGFAEFVARIIRLLGDTP